MKKIVSQSEGDRLRDEGIARALEAERARDDDWYETALDELLFCAQIYDYFTPDHLRAVVRNPPVPQLWGALYTRGKREGWIEDAPEKGLVKSRVKSQHSHPVPWYKSLVVGTTFDRPGRGAKK